MGLREGDVGLMGGEVGARVGLREDGVGLSEVGAMTSMRHCAPSSLPSFASCAMSAKSNLVGAMVVGSAKKRVQIGQGMSRMWLTLQNKRTKLTKCVRKKQRADYALLR